MRVPDFLKNMPQLELDETKKKILFGYVLVALLILVGYFCLFLRPSMAKIFTSISKIREHALEMRTVNEDLHHEDKLTKRLESLEASLAKYGEMLSHEKELPKLLENLSKLARNSRVKLVGITPLDKRFSTKRDIEKKESVYQEVPIVISGQSGYHELGAFINRLETNERFMEVSNIKIKANKNNPKRHDIEFVVYAYTFSKE